MNAPREKANLWRGRLGVVLVLAALAAGAWWLQRPANSARGVARAVAPSPLAESVVAGLGGFRGLIAEAVWFRADRLQDEGRFGELAQLGTWLTFLEPHTPEVWSYVAWNLAYNVSVMMPTPADRWRWVEAGVRLLRDDGLRINPTEPALHAELAWMFLMKVGGQADSASAYYRDAWRRTVETARTTGNWSALKMEPAKMAAVDAEYGAQDWTHPHASALYWAHFGLDHAAGRVKARDDLRRVVYQTLMLESLKDRRFAPRALKELERAYTEYPHPTLGDMVKRFKAKFGL